MKRKYYMKIEIELGSIAKWQGKDILMREIFEDKEGKCWLKGADYLTRAPLLIPCYPYTEVDVWDWVIQGVDPSESMLVFKKTPEQAEAIVSSSEKWLRARKIEGSLSERIIENNMEEKIQES